MILVVGITTIVYVLLMLFFIFGFGKVTDSNGNSRSPSVGFSVVVPFRNEAENLPALLSSLKALDYPSELFEILLVNDDSEDASVDLCREFKKENPSLNIRILDIVRRSGSPKKDAVETAVEASNFPYILTTDADCSLRTTWLRSFNKHIKDTGSELVCGPVMIANQGKTLLQSFQDLDFLSLQASSIGGFGMEMPFLCNGANLCYSKEAFLQVEGFKGNDAIASGDDIFLLEKFLRKGYRTEFLKDSAAIVSTTAQKTLRALVSQRIRWAAKSSAYQNFFPKAVGATVFLMNFLLIVGLGFMLAGSLSSQAFFLVFLLKFNLDFVLIHRAAVFFGKEKVMRNYFWASFIYPFFCSAVVVLSLFSGFEWKGRDFKK